MIPIGLLFLVISGIWMWIALRKRSATLLIALNSLLWLGSICSGYFTYLCWADRGYSENWAAIGFLFAALPYIAVGIVLLAVEITFVHKLNIAPKKALMAISISLVIFLATQAIFGILSI